MVRKLVREGIESIQRGEDPPHINRVPAGVVGTYAHSAVLRVPLAATPEEDKALLRETGRKVLAEWEARQREGR